MHSIKQKEYIDWVYEKLQPFVRKPPRLYEPTKSVRLRTISHPTLTKLMSDFYRNGKKILPLSIEEIIGDPLAVAVWFMDDGNAVIRNHKLVGYHLNTQSYTQSENKTISDAFNKKYGIRSTVEKNHKYYRIGIWQKDSRHSFHELVAKHVIPSMEYKLGHIGDSLRAP